MKMHISNVLVAALFAPTVIVQALAEAHSKSIIVESPSDLPEMAQRDSEAMYLHDTGDGRALLYLQQNQGRTLAILDVTDPAVIRAVAHVSIAAKAPYDFVRAAGDSAALIQYRDQSGFAVINFRKYKHPVLVETPQWQFPAKAETLGRDSLLPAPTAIPRARPQDPRYEVVDVSNPFKPATLATVQSVEERLERRETGTLFLLGNNGLTVIRRPNVEKEYKIEQMQQMGN